MPNSLVALQIVMILLPGFAAAAVVDSLAVRGKQTDFQKSISAALYSFVIYAAFVLAMRRLPFQIDDAWSKLPVQQPFEQLHFGWIRSDLFTLLGITIAVGVLATVYINFNLHRLLAFVRLTERSTRQSIWNDTFEEQIDHQQMVQVEVSGDRSIIGLLSYYSDDADECSLFIEQAAWVDSEGKTAEIPGKGILLTKAAGIRSVSLLDAPGGRHPDAEDE